MFALLLGLAGCSAEIADPIAETHSALMTDPSGTITVGILSGNGAFPVTLSAGGADLYFGGDYALVGGGGGTTGEPFPGALLQDTSPHSTALGQFWRLRVTPHIQPSAFNFTYEAIGLRLSGVTGDALRSMITITQATGPADHQSQATAFPPAGNIVLGGGATAPSAGNQQLLVASMPHFSGGFGLLDGWTAISKDHEQSAIGSVVAYVISIPRCPAGFAGGCLRSNAVSVTSSVGRGYRPVTLAGSGGVLTGVGGFAFYSGAGRMLTTLIPQEDPSTANHFILQADSKDHDLFDNGKTIAWAIVLNTSP